MPTWPPYGKPRFPWDGGFAQWLSGRRRRLRRCRRRPYERSMTLSARTRIVGFSLGIVSLLATCAVAPPPVAAAEPAARAKGEPEAAASVLRALARSPK